MTSGGQTYSYTYDSMGNIASFSAPGKGTVTYTYDNQGQLLSAAGDTTYTYTYDGAGNILTASNGTTSHSYTYGDSNWKDLLTAFDGNSITYDAIGNPTSYYNGTRWTFGWANGRNLATASNGSTSLSFAYDASGLRTGKTVNGTTYRYFYASGKLMRLSWGSNTIDFFYDANGTPYSMKYNGALYYYVTNLQGDIMRIVNASGTVVASYDYDPYGKAISATGTMANVNPLCYRGYVYDTETGFYYLKSRYYDPEICRFINADNFASTGQGFIGNNMFAYCNNNPVNLSDLTGNWPTWATITLGLVAATAAIAVTVATLGAAAPAAACTLTMLGTSVGASYAVAHTAATAVVGTITFVEALYVGDMAYSAVAGDSPLLNTVFHGDMEAYNTGLAITNIATGGMLEAAAQSPGVCFVAGTLVLAAAGEIPIEEIAAGDYVWAWDEETGDIALKRVVETYVNETKELIHLHVNGQEIICTPSHPFYYPVKGWTEAAQLRADDILVLVNGEYVVVEKVQRELLESPITVYNFEVADFHTYYVGQCAALVHNVCKEKPTSPNQMQEQVKRGQAPSTVIRVDKVRIQGQLPHVHFSDGTAMNIDGSVHDAMNGIHSLTNSERIWLLKNGWGG